MTGALSQKMIVVLILISSLLLSPLMGGSAVLAADGCDPSATPIDIEILVVPPANRLFQFEFLGTTDAGKTWCYRVSELSTGPFSDMSHWVLQLCSEALNDLQTSQAYSPTAADAGIQDVALGPDAGPLNTGITGIKWNTEDNFDDEGSTDLDSRIFSFTLQEAYTPVPVALGVKTGGGKQIGDLMGPSCAPTAVDLVRLTAKTGDNDVEITWETAAEIDNAGFNLYRALTVDGAYTQINGRLIVAEGRPDTGAVYTFADSPGQGTFYYRLEDVEITGATTSHGPVSVQIGGPSPTSGLWIFLPFLYQ